MGAMVEEKCYFVVVVVVGAEIADWKLQEANLGLVPLLSSQICLSWVLSVFLSMVCLNGNQVSYFHPLASLVLVVVASSAISFAQILMQTHSCCCCCCRFWEVLNS